MRLIVILLALGIFAASTAQANDMELTVSGGYHWWTQSGHTFIRSDKTDKAFNGFSFQASLTYWLERVGFYLYGGRDAPIKVEMFPNRYYEADVFYAGTGLKVRHKFSDWLVGYLGTGVNFTLLQNEYTRSDGSKWARSEDLPNVGPDVIAGIQLFTVKNAFINFEARYSWNREMSKTFNQTTFDPGGLRTYIGIGYRF